MTASCGYLAASEQNKNKFAKTVLTGEEYVPYFGDAEFVAQSASFAINWSWSRFNAPARNGVGVAPRMTRASSCEGGVPMAEHVRWRDRVSAFDS